MQVRGLPARSGSRSFPTCAPALDRGLALTGPDEELVLLPTYTAMLALRKLIGERGARAAVLGARRVKIRVGHLYPDYLNIYADRGNIAVLARRAAWRGHELDVEAVSMGDVLRPGAHDLLYVGGGQDREQALVAVDLAAKADAVHEAVDGRRGRPRRLRRLPAARALLPRPRRRRAARDRASCRSTRSPASAG